MDAILSLQLHDDDDPSYVTKVLLTVRGAIAYSEPESITIVRIAHWFGPRWLGFSHKSVGAFGVTNHDDLVVPPFVPGRVTNEDAWVRSARGFVAARPSTPLHLHQEGSENRHRSLRQFGHRRAYFWWSGGSSPDGRGALMAYLPIDDGYAGWYAGLARLPSWHWTELRGTTRNELEAFEAKDARLEIGRDAL